VTLVSGTFGKAFGGGGAFLAGGAIAGEWLLQQAGAFRYTTALAPALAAAALAALELIEAHPDWVGPCWRGPSAGAPPWPGPAGRGRRAGGRSCRCWWGKNGPPWPCRSASNTRACWRWRSGPTVPDGTSRLRLVLRRDLPSGSLAKLLAALGEAP
jgi:8-amino-7-oxononanoate synthase